MIAVVTGARGFLGANLLVALRRRPGIEAIAIERATTPAAYESALARADVVYHLAGVNRPPSDADFEPGNAGVTRELCATLRRIGRVPKVVFASSIQVARGNAYGASKRAAEIALEAYARESGAEVAVFRLANVFGKWSRPHHNSFVATFCHAVARGLPVTIDDPGACVELVYVDDVVAAFVAELDSAPGRDSLRPALRATTVTVGQVAQLLARFHQQRAACVVPDLSDRFTRQLHATYASHLDRADLAHPVERIADQRGFVAELLKSPAAGQVFLSRTRPGITRGGHFHDSKVEKFVVVEGEARIRFRHVVTGETAEFDVSGAAPAIVDVPPGYAHDITNTGAAELVTLFWASEIFERDRPDTHPERI